MRNKVLTGLLILISGLMLSVSEINAGNINVAEQMILNYCNGTIDYNGKIYQFTEVAKQEVYNKLMADNIDLTEAQASSAIRQVNANLQQGIEAGYLVETGQLDTETEAESESVLDADTEEQKTEAAPADEMEDTESTDSSAEEKKQAQDSFDRLYKEIFTEKNALEVREIVKETLEEGQYGILDVDISSDDGTEGYVITAEQFLKGTVQVVAEDNKKILSAELPVKNTGYFIDVYIPLLGALCIFLGFMAAQYLGRKNSMFMSAAIIVCGVIVVILSADMLLEHESATWKSIWVKGNPEYAYQKKTDLKEFYPLQGEQYGEIVCEEIQMRVPLYYGDSKDILAKGAGTYSGNSLPGQKGEILVGGHDTTYFAPLQFIENGMQISINTVYGNYAYEVKKTEIVDVLEYEALSDEEENLVLYTCYPFGSQNELREERFFVYAQRVFQNAGGEE